MSIRGTMDKKLIKELKQRGTAEITDGVVNQVTQCLKEAGSTAEFLLFGELKEKTIISIDEACANCDHCYFKTTKECQVRQAKDAKARGFTKLVCPQQFI